MIKHVWKIASLLVVVALMLSACGPGETPEPTEAMEPTEPAEPTEEDEEFLYGLILVGPYNDHGWSEAHYTAAEYLTDEMPNTRFIYLDKMNTADRPETTFEQVVDDMVADGVEMIFATSDDMKEDTDQAAEKYPEVTFVHISGDHVLTGEAPPNVDNYMGQMVYGKMIAGCAAALATETGTIGYVGPLINEETRRLASSAYLGARYCYENYRDQDPDDLRFIVTWIGFWFNIPGVTLDPTEVSNDLINEGADVLVSGIDTTEAIVVAGQRAEQGERVFAVPYDYEGACEEAPDVCLGVPYFNWVPGYRERIEAVMDGTWEPQWVWEEPNWENLNDVNSSPIGFLKGDALDLHEEWATQLDEFIAGLADDSIQLFEGPMNYQDGTEFLADGEEASDEQIWYMEQLLEGMEGPSE